MCLPHLGDPARIAFAEPLEKVPIPDPSLASLKLALSSSLVLCLIYSREAPCSLAGKLSSQQASKFFRLVSLSPGRRQVPAVGKAIGKCHSLVALRLFWCHLAHFYGSPGKNCATLYFRKSQGGEGNISGPTCSPRTSARSVEIHTKPRSPQGQAVRC